MPPQVPIRITAETLSRLVEHAHRENPLECCGFLTGSSDLIDRLHPVPNAALSPTRFRMAPDDLFSFFRELRATKRHFLGIYHSHPDTPARPSERDTREFHYPGVSYWIVSLLGPGRESVYKEGTRVIDPEGVPDVRCYKWVKMGFLEVPFEEVPTPLRCEPKPKVK